MLYLVALVCPPLAILLCGKLFQAILNGMLWAAGVVSFLLGGVALCLIALLHAVLVVSSSNADRRHRQLIREMRRSR